MPLPAEALRVLGIDPGSRITGYGIVDYRAGKLVYVASGCIHTAPRRRAAGALGDELRRRASAAHDEQMQQTRTTSTESVVERLGILYRAIETLIGVHGPHVAAVEQVFVSRNVQSALKLGQARGAVLAAVVANRLQVAEYAARRVKQAVTGTGAGDKSQVQHMVRVLLDLNAPPAADAADALAVAICHLHATGANALPVRVRRRR